MVAAIARLSCGLISIAGNSSISMGNADSFHSTAGPLEREHGADCELSFASRIGHPHTLPGTRINKAVLHPYYNQYMYRSLRSFSYFGA